MFTGVFTDCSCVLLVILAGHSWVLCCHLLPCCCAVHQAADHPRHISQGHAHLQAWQAPMEQLQQSNLLVASMNQGTGQS